ncbi:MAG: hypothetical protein ACYDC1_06345 [Limisphaerales bacterium]
MAITLLNLEEGTKTELVTWLQSWFDGAAHALPGFGTPTFPLARITGGQASIGQPLDDGTVTPPGDEPGEGLAIAIAIHPGRRWTYRDGSGVRSKGRQRLRIDFHVMASRRLQAGDRDTPDSLCQRASDLLYGLLTHPDSRNALVRKGLVEINPRSASALPTIEYAHRLVPCSADAEYDIPD